MPRSDRATLLALAATATALTATASHPISSVYGTFERTSNTIALSLDATASEDLHARPGLADPNAEISRWLATCLRIHDRQGKPLHLAPDAGHSEPRVISEHETINYPLSISYTPVPSRTLLPPTRLVFTDAERESRSISLPNTGESQKIGEHSAIPAILQSEALFYADPDSGEFVLCIRAHVMSLPAEILHANSPIDDGVIDENEAAQLAKAIQERILTSEFAGNFEHGTVTLAIPAAPNGDAGPFNPRLTFAEITQRWPTDELPMRMRLPLESLGQASMRVTVTPRKGVHTRGLATRQDPWVVVETDGARIGRDASDAETVDR